MYLVSVSNLYIYWYFLTLLRTLTSNWWSRWHKDLFKIHPFRPDENAVKLSRHIVPFFDYAFFSHLEVPVRRSLSRGFLKMFRITSHKPFGIETNSKYFFFLRFDNFCTKFSSATKISILSLNGAFVHIIHVCIRPFNVLINFSTEEKKISSNFIYTPSLCVYIVFRRSSLTNFYSSHWRLRQFFAFSCRTRIRSTWLMVTEFFCENCNWIVRPNGCG